MVLITSCKKSGTTATSDPEPVANFTIANTIEPGVVVDGTAIVFDNGSLNADSYEWDFGDGITSAERNPRGVILRPCGRNHTIRLTVRTRSGRTAVIIRTIFVRCR
jgi:PKD repeat protein